MHDALGAPQSILLLGGTSDLGLATLRRVLAAGRTRQVTLAGRDPAALEAAATDLAGPDGPEVTCRRFDALDVAGHEAFVAEVTAGPGDLDLVILAFGHLPDQTRTEEDPGEAVRTIGVNFTGAVSVLVPLIRAMRAQGQGTVVVFSSVAAERPRRANFTYGAAKAGLDAWCQGMADRLVGTGVRLLVVRPGFVHTKMTAGMRPAPLATDPDAVAEAVVRGLARGATTVWAPPALRYVMSGLRHLPRPVYRRLPL